MSTTRDSLEYRARAFYEVSSLLTTQKVQLDPPVREAAVLWQSSAGVAPR